MKQKILYVEDEPFLGKIVMETLEREGYEVLLKTDGATVMESFTKFMPDVCVLDIMLPNLDGLILGKAIRNKFGGLPIIFVTAKSQTEDVVKGFESGGTDYIKKPFSIMELIARISNQLKLTNNYQSKKNPFTKEIKFGDFAFYPEKYELYTKDNVIKLSYKETQILSILTSSPNRIIDRKTLLLSVWGDDSYYNSRTLDVYIRKLRDYLSLTESIEIHTLKGKGYNFITHK